MIQVSLHDTGVIVHALRFLANDLHIALVCAGTEAKTALMTDQQLADRWQCKAGRRTSREPRTTSRRVK
jgi:hypothetical protein